MIELICPECMGTLAPADAKTVRCTVHGGTYQALFVRGVSGRRPAPAEALVGVACSNHPNVSAAGTCLWCGVPICATCGFAQPDGRFLCPNCMAGHSGEQASSAKAASGQTCAVHPNVQAVHVCIKCGKAICETCAFTFPGNVVVCTSCATESPGRVSSKRRKYAWWSLGLATLSTVSAGASIVFGPEAATEEEAAILGVVWMLFAFTPALVGMGLGFSGRERNLPTPGLVWAALIWNCVLVVLYLLLIVAGNLMG